MITKSRGQARLDANETVFFSRQLESIDPTEYFVLFAGLLGRRYIPLIDGVAPWANVYTYRMFEIVGQAKVGAPNAHAKDHPSVQVIAREYSRTVKEIPVVYGWTVREIQQAAATGTPLDRLTVQAAMSAVARKVDQMLAFGEEGTDITGLANHPSVEATNIVTPVAKTGGGTAWSGATVKASEIIADVNKLVSTTRARLKQASAMPGGDGMPAFQRYTVLLPTTNYALIASTPRSDNSDTTILKYLLQNNPWIESIEEWSELDTADPSGGGRAVAYPRDPMALGALIPQEFESRPPQEEGHDIVIPALGTCGGTVIRYPVAVSYMDDI